MLHRSPLNPTQFLLPPCPRQPHCLVHSWCPWVHVGLWVHICADSILFRYTSGLSQALLLYTLCNPAYPSWCLKWLQRKLWNIVESKLRMKRVGGWTFLRQWNFLETAWRWGVFWQELTSLLPVAFGVCMAKGTAGQWRRVSSKCYLPHTTIL